jgi:hypothetical protein
VSERVTITIEPSLEQGDTLTVQDAMRQVLDFIEVVSAAASDDARPKIAWKLVSATTNSPFTAVAEAEAVDPEWPDIERDVRAAKHRITEAFSEAYETGEVPEWITSSANENFMRLLRRNLDGIGKTEMRLVNSAPPIVIVERVARHSLDNIKRLEMGQLTNEPDYSGEELGSVEGAVIEALTHKGRPALRIRDNVSEDDILCVFSRDKAESIGTNHNLREVWSGQRVTVFGLLKRKRNGSISIVEGDDLIIISAAEAPLSSFMDENFTSGRGVTEFLSDVWGEPFGKN